MKRIVQFALLLITLSGFSQELPPVVNYDPSAYGADNQNWMISQSNEQYIYVANNKGLLEFNGASWELYPTPNETIMRSVNAIGDRIYSGCYMDFGYWQRTGTGTLGYTSLAQQLNVEMIVDEQIWNIIDYEGSILFQSLNRIYIYNKTNESISIIDAGSTLTKLFMVDNVFFYHVMGEGLYTIENRGGKLVSDDPVLQQNNLVHMFRRSDQYVLLTANNGFYTLNNGTTAPWPVPADSILRDRSIYNSITLSNGDMMLGTIANGMMALSADGEFLYQMDQSNGLGDNTTLSLFEDSRENIWLALDNGIDFINTNAPFTSYFDRNGPLGTVYVSALHNGHLYLGTNQGLFFKPYGSDEDFKIIRGTEGQVWNLRVIDGELFCGHNLGTFLVTEDNAELITNVPGTWEIKRIPGREDLLIQGNYQGLNVLVRENGQWRLRNKITGFDISSKYFEITGSGTILVSHEYKGVYRLNVNESYTEIESYAEMTSVKKGAHSGLVSYHDEIYYAYRDGIFVYDASTADFKRDEMLSAIFDGDQYISGKLIDDGQGKLWAFTKDALVYIFAERLNNQLKIVRIPIPLFQRSALEGYENIAHLKDEEYLVGTSSGYLHMDLGAGRQRDHYIKINRVVSSTRTGEETLVDLSGEGEFLANQNYLSFQYSSPDYHKFHIIEYQYQLTGLFDQWSEWSTESSQSFDNLPFGSYEFKVRSRISNVESSNVASYAFEINRPWYLSNLAVGIYVVGVFLLFVGINAFYKRYYRKQRQRLLEKKAREMELQELESQKEIIQLKNQSLNLEIESRNRELAVSTMSMVKKNSILNDLKTELETITDLGKLPNVIRTINKNLNNEDDWKFFEKAFNHADKDFFKKVKEMHPELTPNDLRLCVYLRLNLSSKEIAPLLNISPRSVEIKRYRLRKKIDLPRHTNLNDYFISL